MFSLSGHKLGTNFVFVFVLCSLESLESRNCLCADCAANAGRSWKITYLDSDGKEDQKCFDFVIICSGFNQTPHIPEYYKQALLKFSGKAIHSSEYRDWRGFENQKVVVCGLGNSGGKCFSFILANVLSLAWNIPEFTLP